MKINRHIDAWLKEKSRLVIAIEGYSASGKTTVADCVAKGNKNIAVVHLDDLLKSSKERVDLMNSGEDRSKVFEFKWYQYDLLNTLVEKFRQGVPYSIEVYDYDLKKMVTKTYDLSKQVLIVEGIFLLHPEHEISKAFDKRIYLAVDFDKADNRRNRREKKRWGKNYVDESHLSTPTEMSTTAVSLWKDWWAC